MASELDVIDRRIAEIVKPLTDELAEIDRRIAEHETATRDLREKRKVINAIVGRANGTHGTPGPRKGSRVQLAKPGTGTYAPPSDQTLAYVRAFIGQGEGFDPKAIVAGPLAVAIEERAGGLAHPSKDAVRRAVRELHARGELRVTNLKAKGGGIVYATTAALVT